MRDTIEMAREAGFDVCIPIKAVDGSIAHLKAFAALVRAAEREACAQLCIDISMNGPDLSVKFAAHAIRARSNA